ncbi:hypothetical protein AB0N09_22540 [Streptomyces erythrochromogenes]|uniref:hypothetical protein n=1 Tax=Streptomyces erythrochromogenes TaxID=285574 RepID=UPI0034235930
MRRSITSGLAAAAAAASLAAISPSAIAATVPTQVAEPAPASTAACVELVGFYTDWPDRFVTVRNNCGSTACFSVTVAANRDPKFSIGGNRQQSFRYGGALWTQGTGIKNIGC